MLRRLRAEGGDQADRTTGADGRTRPAHRGDTTDRDDTIRRLRAEGDSLRTIAVRVGVSASTVHRVLGKSDQQPSG